VTAPQTRARASLEKSIKDEAGRLGFVLAGFTTPDPPPHASVYEHWLSQGRHASMSYLSSERARARRANPRLVLSGCRSMVVLGVPYSDAARLPAASRAGEAQDAKGRFAAYAWGADYHLILPERLEAILAFIEAQVGRPVSGRWYTDTGPILERDLAQRAGLGWIGKNTCLIHPRHGSYFLLAEILLDLELEADVPFTSDYCGRCTRCIEACPTRCILPDRTLDAARCISYLTIELRDGIPLELRPFVGDWVFGCDICQMVCPWNRFASAEGKAAFGASTNSSEADLITDMLLTPEAFNQRFKDSPIRRARLRGYRRNVITATGNRAGLEALRGLGLAAQDPDGMIRENAFWAIDRIDERMRSDETTANHHEQ
jgi:epoxyqueuosine reductase